MTHEESLDAAELAELETRWGAFPVQHHVLQVSRPFLTGNHQQLVSDGRRAEICYVMHRGDPADGVLLHIKSFYPQGAFRLPTGGIHRGQSVEDTLEREIYEETGLVVHRWNCDGPAPDAVHTGAVTDGVCVERLLGVSGYQLQHAELGDRTFATYFFLTRMPPTASLMPTDPEEKIAAWTWTPAGELLSVADRLATIGRVAPDWADWGRFRAFAHQLVAAALV